MNYIKPRQVGDIALFRYVDAESYDPWFKEIFSGIIIDVRWRDDAMEGDPDPDLVPIYKVMCSDGHLRNFPHWELFDPEDIDKASRFEEVAEKEE